MSEKTEPITPAQATLIDEGSVDEAIEKVNSYLQSNFTGCSGDIVEMHVTSVSCSEKVRNAVFERFRRAGWKCGHREGATATTGLAWFERAQYP